MNNCAAPTSLPVPNPTCSFWTDFPGANVLAKEGSQGDLTVDADICIIGSGITGVSVAYHLATMFSNSARVPSKPIKVVIFEARDFCSGATGRNGGHLTPGVFRGFEKRVAVHGIWGAKKTYDLEAYTTNELIKIIETEHLEPAIDFVSSCHVWLLLTEQEETQAKKDYAAAQAAGTNLKNVEWKSKEEIFSMYGISFPAYVLPGHNLWPLKLVTELYYLARDLNPAKFSLILHTNTPVTTITPATLISSSNADPLHRRWTLSTVRGIVHCSYIIHATNAYASHLLPHLQGPTGIIPTRGQVLTLRAAASLSEFPNSSWQANNGSEYWFSRPVSSEGESPLVVLGGGREITGPTWESYETDDSVISADVSRLLKGFLPEKFPRWFGKGREPEMEWTGIMGFTTLGVPFVGPIVCHGGSVSEYEGQYISAGYQGHGMPRAYTCGQVVAEMIVADIMGGSWTPPIWLPPQFLTTNRSKLVL